MTTATYKPGDPPPTDYMAWHAWAEVQHRARLKQRRCGKCGRWKYPQELSGRAFVSHPHDARGRVYEMVSPICKPCQQEVSA